MSTFALAKKEARSVPGGVARAYAEAELGGAAAQIGLSDDADAAIRAVQKECAALALDEGGKWLAYAAELQVDAGAVERADLIVADLSPDLASLIWSSIAAALRRAGRPSEAEPAAERARGSPAADTAHEALAVAFASAGQIERAVEIAEAITDPSLKVQAYVAVAEEQVRRGKTSEAAPLYQSAVKSASSTDQAVDLLELIVRSSARALGSVSSDITDLAIERASALEDAEQRGWKRGVVAALLAEVHGQDRADALAQSIDDSAERLRAIAKLADVHARQGQFADSRKAFAAAFQEEEAVAGEFERTRAAETRDTVLAEMADAVKDRGDFARATQAALAIHDPERRVRPLIAIARGESSSGLENPSFAAALAAAEEVQDGLVATDPVVEFSEFSGILD